MADAIVDNRTRDLWKEVKKIKGRNNASPANVDGATNVDDILNTFSVKYRNLYNSVPYDNNRMSKIQQEINERLNLSKGMDYCITVDDIIKAVNKLISGKSDGEEGLNSDHIINHGPHLLHVILTNFNHFNCMLTHGFSPDSMMTGSE